MDILVGDTIYFSMGAEECFNNEPNAELWAHDTSNHSTWQVAEIRSGNAGSSPGYSGLELVVGDTIYFDANDGGTGREVWAHDTSNHSTWLVDDFSGNQEGYIGNGKGGYDWMNMEYVINDTIYFEYNNVVLRAHNTSNQTSWDIDFGGALPGQNFHMQVGDAIYFSGRGVSSNSNHNMKAYDLSLIHI